MVRNALLVFLTLTFSLVAQKKALIFGVTGQDGSYLAEFLLEKDYEVHGVKRSSSSPNTMRIDHIYEGPQEKKRHFILHYGDLTDSSNISRLIQTIQPDEIYNLGAQSHVQVSFECPAYTTYVDALGPLYILDAIHSLGLANKTRYYQASTSEMYGKVREIPQNEMTPFHPRSPYGVAKVAAYWRTVNYREAYGIFACNGILFNHESPRRGHTFITRKITLAATRIKLGLQNCLYLGNLNSKRDFGYAKDYIEAMWQMLQQDEPEDFVIATKETHSGREFAELAFQKCGMEIEWQGEGLDEIGIDKNSGKVVIRIDARYFRPAEVDLLLGDPQKAIDKFGWDPQKTPFDKLVEIMVEADLKLALKEAKAIKNDEE